jgi:hypothetical protein
MQLCGGLLRKRKRLVDEGEVLVTKFEAIHSGYITSVRPNTVPTTGGRVPNDVCGITPPPALGLPAEPGSTQQQLRLLPNEALE